MGIGTQVQTILNDTGVFWTTDQVLDAVNEAQFYLFMDSEWHTGSATLTVHDGDDIVDIPSTIVIPNFVEGTVVEGTSTTTRRFFPSTQRELENLERGWRGHDEGQPQEFIIWDATHLRVFPKPDATYEYTLYGVGVPTEITALGDTVAGPAAYVMAVQNATVSLLLEATRPDLADQYMKTALTQLQAFKRRNRNNQSHNIRRLRPASTRLEVQQGGQIQMLPVYYPVEA